MDIFCSKRIIRKTIENHWVRIKKYFGKLNPLSFVYPSRYGNVKPKYRKELLSAWLNAAQDDGIFGADLMTTEAADAPGVIHHCRPGFHLDGAFGANSLTFSACGAPIGDYGAFSGRFFAGQQVIGRVRQSESPAGDILR